MTIVAGLTTPDGFAYIAADSGAGHERLMSGTRTPKVAQFGTVLVGFAGSFQQGRAAFAFLEGRPYKSPVATFEKHWRAEKYGDTQFLFIESGNLYEVSTDGGVVEAIETYGAIGTGADVALGALGRKAESLTCLNDSLHIVKRHVPGIKSPWQTLQTQWL